MAPFGFDWLNFELIFVDTLFKPTIYTLALVLISIIISLTILYILSNIIFSVDIVYNNKEIVNLLNKELNNYNIKKYQLKKSYDNLEIIKKEILENNKDKLEWLYKLK